MNTNASRFLWVGGHRGLDLVNTEAVGAGGDRLDLVPRWADLVDWATTAGLLDNELAGRCHAVSKRRGLTVVEWFGRLRTALRALLESAGDEPSAVRALDAAVAEVAVRLSYRAEQRHDVLPVEAAGAIEQLRLALATAALDAARLDPARVRRCGDARCILVYYDTTKNGSRRWCDMAVCGNRAKAQAHYRRRRDADVR